MAADGQWCTPVAAEGQGFTSRAARQHDKWPPAAVGGSQPAVTTNGATLGVAHLRQGETDDRTAQEAPITHGPNRLNCPAKCVHNSEMLPRSEFNYGGYRAVRCRHAPPAVGKKPCSITTGKAGYCLHLRYCGGCMSMWWRVARPPQRPLLPAGGISCAKGWTPSPAGTNPAGARAQRETGLQPNTACRANPPLPPSRLDFGALDRHQQEWCATHAGSRRDARALDRHPRGQCRAKRRSNAERDDGVPRMTCPLPGPALAQKPGRSRTANGHRAEVSCCANKGLRRHRRSEAQSCGV